MLPCNVIVYEKDGKMSVAIVRPTVVMQVVQNKNLEELAVTIEKKLRRVFEAI